MAFPGINANRELIPACDQLLTKNGLNLSDIDLLAVNHGPGAFTALRIVVTLVNAIAFATKIKIIPICGLEALFWQIKNDSNIKNYDLVACTLNAYSGQIFVSIYQNDGTPLENLQSRCLTAEAFLKEVSALEVDKILIAGNGCQVLIKAIEQGKISTTQRQNLIFDPKLISAEPSAQTIAIMANEKISTGQIPESKIIPNYIKSSFAKPTD